MNGARDEQLVSAFVERAQHGLGTISPEQLDDGWDRLQLRKAPAPAPRRPLWTWRLRLTVASAAAALAVAAWAWLTPRPPIPLRYVIEGVAATSGSLITSLPGEPARLRFSDESSVALGPATKLALRGVHANGADVLLVDGTLDVVVKHRAGTAWRFAAGPFRVDVKGTTFALSFEARTGHLGLRMATGLVEVSAPPNRTLAVAAGESIDLYAPPPAEPPAPALPRAAVASSPTAIDNTLAPAPEKSAPPRPAVKRPSQVPGEAPEPQAAPVAWSGRVAKGDFAGVVADAERRGLDTAVAEASAAELAALADAARYTKRPQLALKVLLALRARFAGSDPAKDAAFFLGRLAETAPGRPASALDWYDTYLRESPGGLYASETLGREMTLLADSAPARARKVARAYLERFPQGPQAGLARSLLEAE